MDGILTQLSSALSACPCHLVLLEAAQLLRICCCRSTSCCSVMMSLQAFVLPVVNSTKKLKPLLLRQAVIFWFNFRGQVS